MARAYAITGDEATRAKVIRLNRLCAKTITAHFYETSRFPAYIYDKLLLGLIDSHTYVKDPLALSILEQTTNTALPHLPGGDDLYASLTKTHASFETPCGAYAHFKLTRYLLRVTRDARYGDSMERVMYNTVLGAKPLHENGETFYYSDYNFNAKRVYKKAHWACCAGTLPQVATDYRINAYLRGPQALYVILYVPSTVRWTENGAALSLTQEGQYPQEDHVRFTLTSSKPTELTLHFRIPAWAEGATVSVKWGPPERAGKARRVRSNPARMEDRRPRGTGASTKNEVGEH